MQELITSMFYYFDWIGWLKRLIYNCLELVRFALNLCGVSGFRWVKLQTSQNFLIFFNLIQFIWDKNNRTSTYWTTPLIGGWSRRGATLTTCFNRSSSCTRLTYYTTSDLYKTKSESKKKWLNEYHETNSHKLLVDLIPQVINLSPA